MRSFAAFVLLLVGAVLVPVATVGWWAHTDLVPTTGYVATVAPLATDPAVVAAVEDRLVAATMQPIDRAAGTAGAAAEPIVRSAVARVVADPVFARAWRASSRDVHRQLVSVLAGHRAVRAGSTVQLELAPLSAVVRRELVRAGVPFASQLPTVQAGLPLFPTRDLTAARGAYSVVARYGGVLPVGALVVILLGLLVARRRGASLARTALASLVGLALVVVAVLLGRTVFSSSVPATIPSGVAHAVYDTVVSGLWRDLLVVAAGAAVAVLAGLVIGRAERR